MSQDEFHARALYATATEEGLHVGWIDGPQGSDEQKRLSFYVDFSEVPQVYAICVGPGDFLEVVPVTSNEDVVRIVQQYQARTAGVPTLEER